MFIVLLRYTDNRGDAHRFMDEHVAWIRRGFDDGVFLLAGTLQPHLGGAIVAHDTTRSSLQIRLDDDPFVARSVVRAEVIEVTPSIADQRLFFLLA